MFNYCACIHYLVLLNYQCLSIMQRTFDHFVLPKVEILLQILNKFGGLKYSSDCIIFEVCSTYMTLFGNQRKHFVRHDCDSVCFHNNWKVICFNVRTTEFVNVCILCATAQKKNGSKPNSTVILTF